MKISSEAQELAEALEKVTTDVATLRAVLSGVYEWTLGDLIAKAEMFMVSAVEGLYEATEGPKSVTSYSPYIFCLFLFRSYSKLLSFLKRKHELYN